MLDKRKEEFDALVSHKFKDAAKEASCVEDNISFKFTLHRFDLPDRSEDFTSKNEDKYVDLTIDVHTEDLETRESVKDTFNLFKLPVYMDMGFLAKGNYYKVQDSYKRATGWSIVDGKTIQAVEGARAYTPLELKIVTRRSRGFSIFKDIKGHYKFKRYGSGCDVRNLFLTLDESSEEEIIKKLGGSRIASDMFSLTDKKDEDSAKVLISEFYGTKNTLQIYESSEIKRKLKSEILGISGNSSSGFKLDKDYKDNVRTIASYSKAIGRMLLEPIVVNDVEIKEFTYNDEKYPLTVGTVLDYRNTEFLDQLAKIGLDTITVSGNSSSAIYDSASNRGSDISLEESVVVVNRYNADEVEYYNKLVNMNDVDNLYDNLRNTKFPNTGKVSISLEDLYSVTNAYIVALSGMIVKNNTDELYNKRVVPFTEIILDNFVNALNRYKECVFKSKRDRITKLKNSNAESEDTELLLNPYILKANSEFQNIVSQPAYKDELFKQLKTDDKESEVVTLVNTFSETCKDFKMSSDAPESTGIGPRAVKPSQWLYIDTFNGPESQKVGLQLSRTLLTDVKDGIITTPFIDFRTCEILEDGSVKGKIVNLTPHEVKGKNIALWNSDFREPRVFAVKDGKGSMIDIKELDLIAASCWQCVSVNTGLIAFIQCMDGKRCQMSACQSSQRLPVLGGQPPLMDSCMIGAFALGYITADDIIQSNIQTNFGFRESLCAHYSDLDINFPTSNEEITKYLYEKLKDKEIELSSSIIKKGNRRRTLEFTMVIDDRDFHLRYSPIVGLRTKENTEKTTLVTLNKFKFKGSDVVVRNGDIGIYEDAIVYGSGGDKGKDKMAKDITIPKVIDENGNITRFKPLPTLDYGYMQPTDNVFKVTSTLGVNLRVCFKIHSNSSIEDSIVLCKDISDGDILSSSTITKIKIPRRNPETGNDYIFLKGALTGTKPVSSIYNESGHIKAEEALPKIGDWLNPNQPIVTVCEINQKDQSIINCKQAIITSPTNQGQVIAIYDEDDFKIIEIKKLSKINVGDKMSGDHGNKGVVSLLEEAQNMVYDEEGPYDIVINCGGIPTRMNQAQLKVAKFSEALQRLGLYDYNGQLMRIMLSQFNLEAESNLKELYENYGSKPKILYDGHTGLPFDTPVETGVMYMFKLVHMVEDKVHQIGTKFKVDDKTGRPGEGKKRGGGQKMGEMEELVNQAYPGHSYRDYYQQLDVSSKEGQERFTNALLEEVPRSELAWDARNNDVNKMLYNSQAKEHMRMYYRMHYISLETMENEEDIEKYKNLVSNKESLLNNDDTNIVFQVRPLTDDLIRGLAKDERALNYKAGMGENDIEFEPEIRSNLQSDAIFGNSSNSSNDFYHSWSYLNLGVKIPSPVLLEKERLFNYIPVFDIEQEKKNYSFLTSKALKNIKNKKWKIAVGRTIPCDDCKDLQMLSIIKDDSNGVDDNYIDFVVSKIKELTGGESSSDDNDVIVLEGIEAIVYILEFYKVNGLLKLMNTLVDSKKYKMKEETKLGNLNSLFDYEVACNRLKSMKIAEIELSDYVVSTYPVCPRSYRFFVDSNKLEQIPSFDKFYITLAHKVSNRVGADQLYKYIVDFLAMGTEYKTKKKTFEYSETLNGFLDKADDKGFLRECMTCTRVPMSGRSVITPIAEPSLSVKNIGLPFFQVLAVLKNYLATKILEDVSQIKSLETVPNLDKAKLENILSSIQSENYASISEICEVDSLDFAKNLYEEVFEFTKKKLADDKFIVMDGRQPTLHTSSLMGFFPIVVKGQAIQLNPLNCKSFNADFDGDQMHWEIIVPWDAREDVKKYYMVNSNMIDYATGDNLILPSQDMLIGLFNLTMLKDNTVSIYPHELRGFKSDNDCYKSYWYYDSIDRLIFDVRYRNIPKHALVRYKHTNGKEYISTAGRIIFNSYLVDDFGFTDVPIKQADGVDKNGNPKYKYNDELRLRDLDKAEGYFKVDLEKIYAIRFDGPISGGSGSGGLGNAKKLGDTYIDFLGEKRSYNYQSLASITQEYTKNFSPDETIYFLDRLKELGFEYAGSSGCTLSYDDHLPLPSIDRVQTLEEKAEEKVKKLYRQGFISDKELDSIIDEINEAATKEINSSWKSHMARNNSFFMLVDSGAKGSPSNIQKSCGRIGHIADDSGKISTPVRRNYIQGVNAYEFFLGSYKTRQGFSAQQIGIKDKGYLARTLGSIVEGMVIRQHDCRSHGITERDIKECYTDISYGTFKFMVRDTLLGKTLADSEKDQEYYRFTDNGKIDCVECARRLSVLDRKENDTFIPLELKEGEQERIKSSFIYDLEGKQVSEKTPEFFRVVALLNNGKLTRDSLDILEQQKVPYITIMENGTEVNYYCCYSLPKWSKGLLKGYVFLEDYVSENRRLKELVENDYNRFATPDDIHHNIMTQESADYIERYNIRKLSYRNIINCNEENGLCAVCYGTKHNTYHNFHQTNNDLYTLSNENVTDEQIEAIIDKVEKFYNEVYIPYYENEDNKFSKESLNGEESNHAEFIEKLKLECSNKIKALREAVTERDVVLKNLKLALKEVEEKSAKLKEQDDELKEYLERHGEAYKHKYIRTGYKTLESFAPVGVSVGILASTSIAESATQSALNAVNSTDTGVKVTPDDTFRARNADPKKDAIIAKGLSLCKVSTTGDISKIMLYKILGNEKDGFTIKKDKSSVEEYTVHKSRVLVKDNEIVNKFDQITSGYCNLDDVFYSYKNTSEVLDFYPIKTKKTVKVLAEVLAPDNGAYLEPKHLEVIARVQSSIVKVVNSLRTSDGAIDKFVDDKQDSPVIIPEGTFVSLQRYRRAYNENENLTGYGYAMTSKVYDVANVFGDKIKNTVYEHRYRYLADLLTDCIPFVPNSFFTQVVTGLPAKKERRKGFELKTVCHTEYKELRNGSGAPSYKQSKDLEKRLNTKASAETLKEANSSKIEDASKNILSMIQGLNTIKPVTFESEEKKETPLMNMVIACSQITVTKGDKVTPDLFSIAYPSSDEVTITDVNTSNEGTVKAILKAEGFKDYEVIINIEAKPVTPVTLEASDMTIEYGKELTIDDIDYRITPVELQDKLKVVIRRNIDPTKPGYQIAYIVIDTEGYEGAANVVVNVQQDRINRIDI